MLGEDSQRRRLPGDWVHGGDARVDVTLVLTADPEERFIVGLNPLVYEDLPIGTSGYYRDRDTKAAAEHGRALWEREKKGAMRRMGSAGHETLLGFRPNRLLDHLRFEAQTTAQRGSRFGLLGPAGGHPRRFTRHFRVHRRPWGVQEPAPPVPFVQGQHRCQ
jgi:hypothetical protein